MKALFVAVVTVGAAFLCAPPVPATEQGGQVRQWFEEVNNDVWRPLMAGVEKNDESLYVGVRSDAYVRVQSNGRLLLDRADYADDTKKVMASYQEQGTRLTMEVRFEERIIDGKSASESGVIRVRFTEKGGRTRNNFARFHTISRKENGSWRVLTDVFPPTGGMFGETQFMRLKALDDVDDFRCYMTYPEKKERCDP